MSKKQNDRLQSRKEPPPESWLGIPIKFIWNRFPKTNWLIIAVIVFFVILYCIWGALPSSSQERLIEQFFKYNIKSNNNQLALLQYIDTENPVSIEKVDIELQKI